jgi:hypothetical protein
MVAPQDACTVRLAAGTVGDSCEPATADNTPSLLGRPPKKPAVLDPAPIVVTVVAEAPAAGKGHRRGRDTARR